jgi:hypothetical protein
MKFPLVGLPSIGANEFAHAIQAHLSEHHWPPQYAIVHPNTWQRIVATYSMERPFTWLSNRINMETGKLEWKAMDLFFIRSLDVEEDFLILA